MSSIGIGAILTQVAVDEGLNIIAYASRSLTGCESCYRQTKREALAVVWVIYHFYLFLRDHPSKPSRTTSHWRRSSTTLQGNCETWETTGTFKAIQNQSCIQATTGRNLADYRSRRPHPEHSYFARVDAYPMSTSWALMLCTLLLLFNSSEGCSSNW